VCPFGLHAYSYCLQVSAGSEPSGMGRTVSAAVRSRVGWADDVVGGDRDCEDQEVWERSKKM